MTTTHSTRPSRPRRHRAAWLAAIFFFGAISTLAATPAVADAAPVRVSDAWARWLPSGLPAAGYLTLSNPGTTDVFLTGVTSPDYAMVHLHESYTTADGASGMRMVDKLRIPAGGEVKLSPGGFHLMLMRAKHNLVPGDTVNVQLHFAGGASLTVPLPLQQPGHEQK